MAKVLLINGSPNQHGCTDVALSETAEVLKKEDIEVEMMWLGNGCFPAAQDVFPHEQYACGGFPVLEPDSRIHR